MTPPDLDPYGDEPARNLADPYAQPMKARPLHTAGTVAAPYVPDTWRDQAACKTEPVDTFFPDVNAPDKMAKYRRALAICTGCPVRTPCTAEAIANPAEVGIWGGTGVKVRYDLRREAKAAGVPLEADAIAEWIDSTDAMGTAVA